MIISSIQQFLTLTPEQQGDILRNIKTKEKLEEFLEKRNDKKKRGGSYSFACGNCEGKGEIEVEERNNNDLHASAIHSCKKRLLYDIKGMSYLAVIRNSPRLQLIFDHGSYLHEMLQGYGARGAWCPKENYKAEMKILPNEEEAIRKGQPVLPLAIQYQVRSSVDAILWGVEVPGVRDIGTVTINIVHEYKSISSRGYDYLRAPKPAHLQQASIYSALYDIPIVVFVYYSKDDDRIMDFPCRFDPFLWAEVEHKITDVLSYKDSEEEMPWEKTSAHSDPEECYGKLRDGEQIMSPCPYYATCKPPVTPPSRKEKSEAKKVTVVKGYQWKK